MKYFRLNHLMEVAVEAAQRFGLAPTYSCLTTWCDLVETEQGETMAMRFFPFGTRHWGCFKNKQWENNNRPGFLAGCAPTVLMHFFKVDLAELGLRIEPVPEPLLPCVGQPEGLFTDDPYETETKLEQLTVAATQWLYYAGFNYGFSSMSNPQTAVMPRSMATGYKAGEAFLAMVQQTPLAKFYNQQRDACCARGMDIKTKGVVRLS